MAENNDGNKQLHIAMLPWLAFGHLIPFFELAKLMATKGHHISFISTPRNIDRLPQIPQTLTPFISFIKLNLPKLENLPENAESTKDLPSNKIKYLKIACDSLQKPITDFMKASSPDWILYDFNTYWVGPLSREHGIMSAYFSVFPAVILGFMGPPKMMTYGNNNITPQDFIKLPKWVPFKSEVRPSLFHVTRGHDNYNDNEDNVSDAYQFAATLDGFDVVVVRSSFEFEPQWLKLLNEIYQKRVIPTGVLPATGTDINACWLEIKMWLDKHEKGTVVYIAFGAETKPSQYELTQLALGLELSGLPFYWVLVDQRGSSDDDVIELPCGFEERTRGRGVVCRSWAPQFKILSHDSVGGLLIHSGMSSVVEAFQLGKPLVLLPFMLDQRLIATYLVLDQRLIATYLVEKKMTCMVHRDEVDGSFEPESVGDSLSLVMVKEEGKVYRDKAKEMMSLIGSENVQDKYMDELMCFLQNYP